MLSMLCGFYHLVHKQRKWRFSGRTTLVMTEKCCSSKLLGRSGWISSMQDEAVVRPAQAPLSIVRLPAWCSQPGAILPTFPLLRRHRHLAV